MIAKINGYNRKDKMGSKVLTERNLIFVTVVLSVLAFVSCLPAQTPKVPQVPEAQARLKIIETLNVDSNKCIRVLYDRTTGRQYLIVTIVGGSATITEIPDAVR